MKFLAGAIGAITYLTVSQAFGAFAIGSDTDTGGWTVISGNYDPIADQQTGQESSDIVGATGGSYNAYDTGFFTNWDGGTASNTDGTLGFRVRLDRYDSNQKPSTYEGNLWVGIDADVDGDVDVFVGVANSGSSDHIGVYDAGTGLNNSPNTTTISNTAFATYTESASNYNYRLVTSADGGTTTDITAGGTDTDYYLSFSVNFADIVAFLATPAGGGMTVTDTTPLRYVLGTATQSNSLNQDLGNIDNKNFDPNSTWEQLGGFSPTMTATGTTITAVPEPSSMLLGLAALPFLFRRRRHA